MLTPFGILTLLSESTNPISLQVLSIKLSKDGSSYNCYLSDGRLKIRSTLIAEAFQKAQTQNLRNLSVITLNGASVGCSKQEPIVVVHDYAPGDGIIVESGCLIKFIDYQTCLEIKEDYDKYRGSQSAENPAEAQHDTIVEQADVLNSRLIQENEHKETEIQEQISSTKNEKKSIESEKVASGLAQEESKGNEEHRKNLCNVSLNHNGNATSKQENYACHNNGIKDVPNLQQNSHTMNRVETGCAEQTDTREEMKIQSIEQAADASSHKGQSSKEAKENNLRNGRSTRMRSQRQQNLGDPFQDIRSLSPVPQSTQKLPKNSVSNIIGKTGDLAQKESLSSENNFDSKCSRTVSFSESNNSFLSTHDVNTSKNEGRINCEMGSQESLENSLLSSQSSSSRKIFENTRPFEEEESKNEVSNRFPTSKLSETSSKSPQEKSSAIQTSKKTRVLKFDNINDYLYIRKLRKQKMGDLVNIGAVVASPGTMEDRNRKNGGGRFRMRTVLLMDVAESKIQMVLFGDAANSEFQRGNVVKFYGLKLETYENEIVLHSTDDFDFKILDDDVIIQDKVINRKLRELSARPRAVSEPEQLEFQEVNFVALRNLSYEGTFYVKGRVTGFEELSKQYYPACTVCNKKVSSRKCPQGHDNPETNYRYMVKVMIDDGSAKKKLTLFEPAALKFMRGFYASEFNYWAETDDIETIYELYEAIREKSYKFKVRASMSRFGLDLIVESFAVDYSVASAGFSQPREVRASGANTYLL